MPLIPEALLVIAAHLLYLMKILSTTLPIFAISSGLSALSVQSICGDHIITDASVGSRIVHKLNCKLSQKSKQQYASFYGTEVRQNRQFVEKMLEDGMPVVLVDVEADDKHWLMSHLPINYEVKQKSSVLLVDWFNDLNGGKHYRVMNLPAGQDPAVFNEANDDLSNATFVHSMTMSTNDHTKSSKVATTDAVAIEKSKYSDHYMEPIINDIHDYIENCGGISVDLVKCYNFMQKSLDFGNTDKRQRVLASVESTSGMVPETAAVWREIIETSYRHWTVDWGRPFPFDKQQVVSHRLNSYWYLYIQAPPFQELYYVFLLVDSLHNPNTQLWSSDAVGLYLSNVDIEFQALRESGSVDHDNIYWLKSSPPTQNTQHTIGRSWSSTDSFSLNMNLGFKGKVLGGNLGFNYTKSFTATYQETREITDWSVAENTDPVSGMGKWKYFQQWPVDMLTHTIQSFPRDWPDYFEQSWNPCKVRDVPNLSKFALATHNTVVWAVNPRLKTRDRLNVRFNLNFFPRVAAHTCQVFDGHHKLGQTWIDFKDMRWVVNVADLNNIEYEE